MKKTQFKLLATGLCAVGLFVGMLSVAQADTIAFIPSGDSVVPGEPSGNDAIFFTPNVDITVTALGYYDGVSYPHEVGLFTVGGALLASTSITPTGGFLDGPIAQQFRYNAITSVTLLAGQTYAVDGYYAGPPDEGVYATGGAGANPLITYDYYTYDYNGGFDLANLGYEPPIFGPNFEFTAVPDGGMTVALLGGALVGLQALRRKLIS